MDLFKALELYAQPFNSEYTSGEEYESLNWLSKNEQPKPTLDELVTVYEKYLKEKEQNKYLELRAKAYPSIEQQLDILYHFGIEGWRDEIVKVKNKYPKKEGDIEIKPEDKKGALIMELENKIKLLTEEFKNMQGSNIDIKTTLKDLNQALSAINGFLMIIPDIKKELDDLKLSLSKERE